MQVLAPDQRGTPRKEEEEKEEEKEEEEEEEEEEVLPTFIISGNHHLKRTCRGQPFTPSLLLAIKC